MAHAHLMAAQHGTLNIVEDGAYMVLSLPTSAFDGIDDDNNGKISMVEFNNHREVIVESIRQNATLSDNQGHLALQGIILAPVVPHDTNVGPISQLTVMGRFILRDSDSALRFHLGLYGTRADEQSLEITATRARADQKAIVELTPTAPVIEILPRRV
jgi:hypothetical protein